MGGLVRRPANHPLSGPRTPREASVSAHDPRRPAAPAALGGLLACAAALLALVAPAGAQEPYGPTTTTTAPPSDPECEVLTTDVELGGSVAGEIVGAPVGEILQITFGGEVLGEVEVTDDGAATEFSVVLPDGGGGADALVVVGATVNLECALTGVLGSETERPGEGPGGPGSSSGPGAVSGSGTGTGGTSSGSESASGSGGPLARTGENLPLLVAVALGLLAVGYALRRRTRRA